MKNKQEIGYITHDNSFFKIKKNRKGIITKVYFYNGEHWCKGHWDDDKEKFDLPYVFFNEEINP